MKIVLSWLLDYLDCKPCDINIDRLIHLFNTRTAEIESYQKVVFKASDFFVGKVVSIAAQAEVFCTQSSEKLQLPVRTDLVVEKFYLLFKDSNGFRWATLQDLGGAKEGLMPAISFSDGDSKGDWRKDIPEVDYILDVDNKSINHRPDLWGHYGIAREIAAFLDIPLKPLDSFLYPAKVEQAPSSKNLYTSGDWSLMLQAEKACFRVAIMSCQTVKYKDSMLSMAIRLARVDSKPMNAMVDMTNYVMFDLGHPMHVFDARAFAKKEVVVRMAQQGETLELLDGQKITLTPQDLVVANHADVESLAGVMGGKSSGFQATTQDIVLEAAGFDPGTLRRTAQRCKLRTEALIRFEKYLDPMQNVVAIQRFLLLAQQAQVILKIDQPIISVGQVIEPKTCQLSHQFVQEKMGAPITPDFIKNMLLKLGFNVRYDQNTQSYTVTVPTYRMTKDIKIQEDLVEEIIRSYGFENIEPKLPMRETKPFTIRTVRNIDHIKYHLAYALKMHEVRDYLLYDAEFVARLQLDLKHAVRVKNPMSENWTTLVTSLVPHLIKSVETNIVHHDHIRFFESNRTWVKSVSKLLEKKSIAGIIFDKKSVDFYQSKAELESLFDMLGLSVTWKKPEHVELPIYFDPHLVAQLFVADVCVGFAGMISSAWIHKVVAGSAFVFELDGDYFENLQLKQKHFKPWSKFQEVCHDISLLVPLEISVDTLKQAILKADSMILSVDLIDFFEKPEWKDQRSVTLRYVMNDRSKTMTKNEIDTIVGRVHNVVAGYGAKIR